MIVRQAPEYWQHRQDSADMVVMDLMTPLFSGTGLDARPQVLRCGLVDGCWAGPRPQVLRCGVVDAGLWTRRCEDAC